MESLGETKYKTHVRDSNHNWDAGSRFDKLLSENENDLSFLCQMINIIANILT